MRVRFAAVVEDVRERMRVEGRAVWQLALSETYFSTGATGVLVATSRLGSRLTLRVLEVGMDDRGVVWHTVDKPLAAGTEVSGEVE